MLETILLESEQKNLLRLMVEAARSVPRDERRKFLAAKTKRGTDLMHPGLGGKDVRPFEGDLEALADEGLLRVNYGSCGTPNYDITPLGYRYYERLKVEIGEGPARLEEHVCSYLESAPFQSTFEKAFLKWTSAEGILWQTGAEDRLTEIGHLCREALQEFVEELALATKTDVTHIPKVSTKRRVQAILQSKRPSVSVSTAAAIDALHEYFDKVSGLVQRQEHGALKEGEPLDWRDARRVVFLLAVVMFEFADMLEA